MAVIAQPPESTVWVSLPCGPSLTMVAAPTSTVVPVVPSLMLVGALYHLAPWGPVVKLPFHSDGMFRFNRMLACKK